MNTYQGPARQLAASQLFPRKRLSLAAQATQCSAARFLALHRCYHYC